MSVPEKISKPRVLIVIGVLWRGGGAEKVAASLGNHLTDSGYGPHLLTFYEHQDKFPYHGIYHSFNEQPKGRLAKLFRVPIRIYKIHRYIKENEIDTVVSFLEEANFYTLFAKLIFNRRLPVIVSVRNNINSRGPLFRFLSRRLYPYAKKVVSVTKVVEEILQTDFELKNTTTIYNPLDLEEIIQSMAEPLPEQHRFLKDASPLFITIGRQIRQKGQWHLIRSFTAVVERYPEAKLVLIGEGEYRAPLEKLVADCGLTSSVYFLGKQSNVYQYLAMADVFVFSSLFEGMPNAMLEALAVGLPIISTDCVSGPREIIAPEVTVTARLDYPYQTPFGVLLPAFSINEAPLWQAVSALPLTTGETVLKEAMLDFLKRDWRRGPSYTAYQERVKTVFSRESIMKEWQKLLVGK